MGLRARSKGREAARTHDHQSGLGPRTGARTRLRGICASDPEADASGLSGLPTLADDGGSPEAEAFIGCCEDNACNCANADCIEESQTWNACSGF
jgi:hypothetical protein